MVSNKTSSSLLVLNVMKCDKMLYCCTSVFNANVKVMTQLVTALFQIVSLDDFNDQIVL